MCSSSRQQQNVNFFIINNKKCKKVQLVPLFIQLILFVFRRLALVEEKTSSLAKDENFMSIIWGNPKWFSWSHSNIIDEIGQLSEWADDLWIFFHLLNLSLNSSFPSNGNTLKMFLAFAHWLIFANYLVSFFEFCLLMNSGMVLSLRKLEKFVSN